MSEDALAPFQRVARGIPDNWPGECVLRFDQRADGSLFLSYYGVNDASGGITVDQWRKLLNARVCGWQNIETAPRDGGTFLAFYLIGQKIRCYHLAHWDLDLERFIYHPGVANKPTHWMPLPDPPKNC